MISNKGELIMIRSNRCDRTEYMCVGHLVCDWQERKGNPTTKFATNLLMYLLIY